MALLIPDATPPASSQPGTHALVIGVSAYLHLRDGESPTEAGEKLELDQLTAAARSASEFADWLWHDYRHADLPLRSLRILLSPSEGEVIAPRIKALLSGDYSATRQNVKTLFDDFFKQAGNDENSIAIVYVVGHGVQFSKSGAVLLLSDMAAPTDSNTRYRGAVDMRAMHRAMNREAAAHNQFWFVDVCRGAPEDASRFEKLSSVLEFDDENSVVSGSSALILSAYSGQGLCPQAPAHIVL